MNARIYEDSDGFVFQASRISTANVSLSQQSTGRGSVGGDASAKPTDHSLPSDSCAVVRRLNEPQGHATLEMRER